MEISMRTRQQTVIRRFGVEADAQVCLNCKHFYLHFVEARRFSGLCVPIHWGHCCYPRLKYRRVDDTCGHFEAEEPEEGICEGKG